MKIPTSIIAGDTITWTEGQLILADGTIGNAATGTLSFSIRGAASPLDVAGVNDGSGAWKFTISGTQSSTLNTGAKPVTVYWQAYYTASGNRQTVANGSMVVNANFASQPAGFDGRTQTEIDLAAVRAEISARASGGATIEYTIGNRSLRKEPLSALIALESALALKVAKARQAQNIANGLGNPRRMFVRWGRT